MVLWAAILILQGAGFVGSMTGVPENITVMFLNPTSVRVSWSTSQVDQVEKYDVTYKPTDASYRMVRLVAGNSDAITLTDLQADTQYQLVITAVRAGKKYRSRPIVFRTLEPPRTSPQHDATVTGGPIPPPQPPPLPPSSQQPHAYIQVRGVEVGIVVMVLIVWAGAIALFFNRWGKIRMLLPYQPDYKEQLKVPGTGACAATTTTCTQHSSQHACSQHLHWSNHRVDSLDSATAGGGGGGGGLGWPRSSRPRINSAIDVAGFLSQEFLRRHGSTSRLCRKVRSADNLPLASCNNRQNDDHRNSNDDGVELDREIFFSTPNDEEDKTDDTESKRQSSLESGGNKDNAEISLLEPYLQQSTAPKECISTTITNAGPCLVTKRLAGWKVGGSHEYVKCPIRQSSIIDERFHRHSCEPDFTRPQQHHHRRMSPVGHLFHHQSTESETHSRNRDFSKRTMGASVETQHFGLPILSISEPSPPDERDRLDDYL